MDIRRVIVFSCLTVLTGCAAPAGTESGAAGPARWWKGNTHTHTLWSDGDGAPDMVADWYVQHGYDFLVLSDHNVLSVGERWFPVTENSRLTPARLAALQTQFGDDWVQTREADDGTTEMRLKTLDDLRVRYEEPDAFLFIQGEEITDDYEGIPVHINGLNLSAVIPPQGGDSVVETMQNNVKAVMLHEHSHGKPTLAHVNHPNFGYAISVIDLATLRGQPYFEVFNGHPSVHNAGDDDHPDTDTMWDRAMTLRLTLMGLDVLYGVACDDAHNYHEQGRDFANAGRGWVVVRSPTLDAASLVDAMKRGDFYASTGVELADVRVDKHAYTVHVDPAMAADCTVRFIGTRSVDGAAGKIGEVLLETTDNPAVYTFTGEELYVRAKVVTDDGRAAWTQPVRP